MVRVLHIVDSLDMGGIQTFLLNVYKNIDRKKIQFDFMVFRPHGQVLEEEFRKLGSRIYKLPNWREGLIKNKKSIKLFFKEHKEYKIIHYHAGSINYIAPIKEAYKAGVPIRVMHSHNTKIGGNPLNKYFHMFHKKSIGNIATDYFACGEMAGKWMFGQSSAENKVVVINNGINVLDYAFNESIREAKRKELDVEGKLVIGHVGRFSFEKNHVFFVEIMKALKEKKDDAILLLVGDGIEKENVIKKAEEYGVEEQIRFLGIRRDITELLQAFDVFVLPSLYEGFPVVLVEAQAAGLPCIISNTISTEVVIKPNIQMLDLDAPIALWIDAIQNHGERIIDNTGLVKAGFDIKTTAYKLTEFYINGVTDE